MNMTSAVANPDEMETQVLLEIDDDDEPPCLAMPSSRTAQVLAGAAALQATSQEPAAAAAIDEPSVAPAIEEPVVPEGVKAFGEDSLGVGVSCLHLGALTHDIFVLT